MYVGVHEHEYLKPEEAVNGEFYLEGDYYIDSGKTGDRSRIPKSIRRMRKFSSSATTRKRKLGTI